MCFLLVDIRIRIPDLAETSVPVCLVTGRRVLSAHTGRERERERGAWYRLRGKEEDALNRLSTGGLCSKGLQFVSGNKTSKSLYNVQDELR